MSLFDNNWSAHITRSGNQTCIKVLHSNTLLAQADLVITKVVKGAEDVLEDLYAADITCIQDELEDWLTYNPGEYIWLDGFRRLQDKPGTKGMLTPYLATQLTRNKLGASQNAIGLAFPCPYGAGDLDDCVERKKLVAHYQRALRAVPVPGTPFVTFPLA
ncbi:hypothetical protein LC612_33575 [Nostoc sp. CHAB 5834]|nr:hypothetical protein [Nostoc sp. CHAB 5834]